MIALCCTTAVSAQQVTLTPEAGISAIYRNGYGSSWRPAPKVGISAEFSISEHFSISSGLHYTFRGYTIDDGGTYSNKEAQWIENVSLTRHLLQIPVMAKFTWTMRNNSRFFIEAGPYVGYYIKNHFTSNPIYLTNTPNTNYGEYPGIGTDVNGNTNTFLYQHGRNFDWGASAVIGVEVQRWVIKLQYEMSLGKESKEDSFGANYHSLNLSVGYKIRP